MKQLYLVAIMMTLAIATCFGQYSSLPYFNGFENPQDTAGWTFKKRAKTTGFEVGSAVHCLGFKSMYISPDSGATATYATTASGYVSIAYKSFTLPQGTYTLAFDYQMGGDGSNQDMKVAWVPSSTSLAAASLGASYPNPVQLNQFTDASNTNTFGLSAWRHVTGTVTVPAGGGTYNLCFAFRTNSAVVSAPGACVDNIQLDTVHSSTDCVTTPYNITVVKDAMAGVIVCWSGNATEYEVVAASASDPDDYSYAVHDGITTTCDTFQYSELGEGQFFFYVRPICGNDTGLYGEISGQLIYDVSAHCIDFVTFNAPGTTCTYGSYSNPYGTNGYIDKGPSQMSSRHTIHTDLNETDPRTNGALHTVPMGEIMSVRLGNWNNGSEAESVTYTYNVPAGSNLILMMKYAVVFEEPGHSEPPEFKLEIMNANNQLLDPVCTKANFLCDGTLSQGWHSCQAPGSYGSLSTIWYKDWTTIGVNLTNYAGQTVKIRLTTYDCNASGHFGYAYYTLDCSQAEFTGMSCGSGEATEIKAPDGFNYQWTNNCTHQVVSTSQSLPIAGTDTCSYTCRCSYKEQPSCYFELTAYTLPRLPEAVFSYDFTYSDCQTHISFTNNSFIYLIQNGQKTVLPSEHLTSQTWTVKSRHSNRPYHNRTSMSKNLSTIDVPKEGDTLTITLTGFANGCDDDTVVVIPVPALEESRGVTNRYVCTGQPVTFNSEQYTFISSDSIEIVAADGAKRYITGQTSVQVIDTLKSWCGCDSILELNLSAMITDTIHIDTTICSDQTFCIKVYDVNQKLILDTCPTTTGYHEIPVPSSLGSCDTLFYKVNLQVLDVLKVDFALQDGEICADDTTFTGACTLSFGGLAGYKVEYLGLAKDSAKFVTTPDTVPFEDGNYVVYFDIPKNTWNSQTGEGTYERKAVVTGLGDGVNIEILDGLKEGDIVRGTKIIYEALLTLYNVNSGCGDVPVSVNFTLQYPKDVIAQRWNDFLGVRNSSYNGGYTFAHYQWYKDGQPVESHVATMSQYYNQGELLDFSATYQVALTRANENYSIMTCGFTPHQFSDATISKSTIMVAASTTKNDVAAKLNAPAVGYLYNISGVQMGVYEFQEGENFFPAPETPGIYVMMFVYEDGTSETVKFTIE